MSHVYALGLIARRLRFVSLSLSRHTAAQESILRVHRDKLTPRFKANTPMRKLSAQIGSYLSSLLHFLGVLEVRNARYGEPGSRQCFEIWCVLLCVVTCPARVRTKSRAPKGYRSASAAQPSSVVYLLCRAMLAVHRREEERELSFLFRQIKVVLSGTRNGGVGDAG